VRKEETGEIVYEGPPPEQVQGLVEELVTGLTTPAPAEPRLIQAGMAHLNLVMIHPFSDGNGRMARCLQSLVLARAGVLSPVFISIEEYLGRNTQKYYDVLAEVGAEAWHPCNDARPWVRFTITAHLRQARTMLLRIKETERLWTDLNRLVRDERLPERMLVPLYEAAMGLRVRNATYRASLGDALEGEITEPTASKDLQRLVEADLLLPHGEKRARFYTATRRVTDIRRRLVAERDPRNDADPFAA
jgi:Fic family protein